MGWGRVGGGNYKLFVTYLGGGGGGKISGETGEGGVVNENVTRPPIY